MIARPVQHHVWLSSEAAPNVTEQAISPGRGAGRRAWRERGMVAYPSGGKIGDNGARVTDVGWEFDGAFEWGESLYDALSFEIEVEVDR